MLFFDILLDVLIFMFGSCFGSFLTMLSYRMFHKENDFIFKRSFCPKCHNQLKNISLVPIFSWLFQCGRCTFCKEKISVRYPLIEIANAIIFLLVFKLNGSVINLNTIYFWLLGTFLLLICVVDLEHLCIPDDFQYVFFTFGIVYIFYNGLSLFYHLFSGLIYYFIIRTLAKLTSNIVKKDSIGDGDIPLIAICGSILGLQNTHIFLFLCGVFGIVFSLIYKIFSKNESNRFPFIPSIVLSFVLTFYLSIFYFQS